MPSCASVLERLIPAFRDCDAVERAEQALERSGHSPVAPPGDHAITLYDLTAVGRCERP
jgi:hypothetical protein